MELLDNDPIVVVGMECKFPNSKNTDEFWEQLNSSNDAISEIPRDRWSIGDYYSEDRSIPGKTYSKHGGFVEDVYGFDPLFFRISRSEAKFIDPQQRLMLEVSWRAFENACIVPSSLVGNSVGVFIAASTFDYAALSTQKRANITYYSGIGSSLSIIANRLSYIYNFDGPSFTVDTACSSSLVALHLACQSLKSKESNVALVGGVNVLLNPGPYIGFSKANVLDETGHCKSFDAEGNGFVRGEGCGVVILKRLSDAKKDNNQILAVIDGSAINQDGMSNGISAPNGIAQSKVIEASWNNANVTSEDISFIEAHGTATPLGDPIELNSINKVLKDKVEPCYIGSAKASIGHLEAAAGIAAFIKVLLCIKHNTIPAQCNFNTLNPNVKFDSASIKIPTAKIDWNHKTFGKRIAGINSFGFGGTNAHVVISEYIQPSKNKEKPPSESNSQTHIIVLSAKKKESLLNMAKNLLDYTVKNVAKLKLEDLAYTLQLGREHFYSRVAILAQSIDSLQENLQSFIAMQDNENVIIGKAKRRKDEKDPIEITGRSTQRKNLLEIANLWVTGDEINWNTFYSKTSSFLYGIPSYKFHNEIFRFSPEDLYTSFIPSKKLHPLIHKNESSLKGLKFTTKLSGLEYCLLHHQVDNQFILPAAAYIEMARALGELVLKKEIVCIHNLVLIDPLKLSQTVKGFELNVKNSSKEGFVSFNITSNTVDNQKITHARGKFDTTENTTLKQESKIDLELFKATLNNTIDGESIYNIFEKNHFKYGPTHRTINKIWYSDKYILATLKQQYVQDNFYMDIGLIDGVFQSTFVTKFDKSNGFFVPFSIKKIVMYNQLPSTICAKLVIDKEKSTDNKMVVDVWITDNEGYVIVKLNELTFQKINFIN